MNLIPSAIYFFIGIIILAHFFTPPEYLWTQNTISELSSQGLPHQWIQQLGFVGSGLLLNAGFVLKLTRAKQILYKDLPVMVYGLAVGLTGIFSAAPFLEDVNYSVSEARLHSTLATVAGLAFSAGIAVYIWQASTNDERRFHSMFLILVLGSSIAFGLAENGSLPIAKGVVQRLLYLVSFIWLLAGQKRYEKPEL